MADHDHSTATAHPDHPVPAPGNSLATFAALMVLAILALVVGFSPLGQPTKVIASLLVASVQAVVLSVFFMELRTADKLTWLIAGSGIFWVGLMFLFILTDYLTRYLAVI